MTAVFPVDPEYLEYLRDESRLGGGAEQIAFPSDEEQLRACSSDWARQACLVTAQGARTGICGGAVPQGGRILNLSRMNRLLGLRREESKGSFLLRLQPGVLLADLNDALARRELPAPPGGWDEQSRDALEALRGLPGATALYFPPDPTESGASLGGMVASNASGARSYAYGATRGHVRSLRLVLPDGSVAGLGRGRGQRAEALHFRLQREGAVAFEGPLPAYTMPATKNAAGLFARPDMELIDLVIGCEGTLGVVSEVEVALQPAPATVVGLVCFFPAREQALEFVGRLRGELPRAATGSAGEPAGGIAAIEYFDRASLALLREQKHGNPAFAGLPEVPEGPAAAVYVEIHAPSGGLAEEHTLSVAALLEACGGDEAATWMADRAHDVARLREFRHALPEAVNLVIDARRKTEAALTKLGTDMAVPAPELAGMLGRYERDLEQAGLEAVMFGHIGDSHVHVNILPRTMEEYRRGRELYEHWARAAAACGGTVSAEHGIGKLKVPLLRILYGQEGLDQMRCTIEAFNPGLRLNRGNMIGWP